MQVAKPHKQVFDNISVNVTVQGSVCFELSCFFLVRRAANVRHFVTCQKE